MSYMFRMIRAALTRVMSAALFEFRLQSLPHLLTLLLRLQLLQHLVNA